MGALSYTVGKQHMGLPVVCVRVLTSFPLHGSSIALFHSQKASWEKKSATRPSYNDTDTYIKCMQ